MSEGVVSMIVRVKQEVGITWERVDLRRLVHTAPVCGSFF